MQNFLLISTGLVFIIGLILFLLYKTVYNILYSYTDLVYKLPRPHRKNQLCDFFNDVSKKLSGANIKRYYS